MLTQAIKATLSILLFRAGPEDFPYTKDPGLSRACLALAILSCALFFSLSTPPLSALVAGAVAVGGVAMFVRVLLRLRKLEARTTQTLNALLAVGAVLLLVMRLPASELMPAMNKWIEQITAAQASSTTTVVFPPDDIRPEFPVAPSLLLDFMSIWFIAVSAYIFRLAANLGFFGSALVALLCQFNVTMLLVFTAPLLALLGN